MVAGIPTAYYFLLAENSAVFAATICAYGCQVIEISSPNGRTGRT
jgi:hypothetical protein